MLIDRQMASSCFKNILVMYANYVSAYYNSIQIDSNLITEFKRQLLIKYFQKYFCLRFYGIIKIRERKN